MVRSSRPWIYLLVLLGLLTIGLTTAPGSAWAAVAWNGDWSDISREGGFSTPRSIAIDGIDNVYVLDAGLKVIFKLSAASGQWSNIASNIGFAGDSDCPWAIASHNLDLNNRLYLLNSIQSTSRVVWKYDDTTRQWTDITYGQSFRQPEAIAVFKDGTVYVTDSYDNGNFIEGHVLKLPAGSTTWAEIGDWDNGQFENVPGITVDGNGGVFVTDYSTAGPGGGGRIRRLTAPGGSWETYPSTSEGFRLKRPMGIVRDNLSNLYVADSESKEIHARPNDNPLWWWYIKNGEPNTFSEPTGVAVDSQGYVYVTDPTNKKVYKHPPWATRLKWQTQPGGAVAGNALNPQPVVALAGPSGAVTIGNSSSTISVYLTNANGATLGGQSYVTLNNGLASFSGLSVNQAGTYTLTATGNIPNINTSNSNYYPNAAGPSTLTEPSGSFTITAPPPAAAPTASPPSGSTVANNSTVILSTTTAGANIYYTINGSDPTTSSTSGQSVVITGAPESMVTVKAIAGGAGFTSSPVATFIYTLQPQVAAPTASPVSGTTVANNNTITLSTATAGATIYYTTNGSDPTTGSASGTSVTISGAPGAPVTVKAMAVAANMANSEIASFTFNLQPLAAAPTAVPVSGSLVTNNTTVTLSTATSGAIIYYTTDGSDPTTGSSSGSSVVVTGASGDTVTVKAIASAIDYVDSNISTFTYIISEAVTAPTAEPVSGSTVANNTTVTLSTTTAGATIYYTVDGSDPTTAGSSGISAVITGAPDEEITVKAFAAAPGMVNSEIAAFTYYLQSQAAAPTASLPDGSLVIDNTSVSLLHSAPGATIYYTIDGSAPTTSSLSGTSVIITGSAGDTITVQALAVIPGMENSEITAFSYTIAQQVEAPTASLASGTTVANGTAVTLSTTTAGATIYYTTNGSDPTSSSVSGTSVTINGTPDSTVTVKAFATAPGMVDSSIAAFTYTFQPLADTPTAVPSSGSVVVDNTTVTLLTGMDNATIYYTLDGSDPTTSSDSGSSVIVSGAPGDTIIIKALAAAPDRENSDIATFTYTIGLPAELPTVSIPSGATLANNTTVGLSSAIPNATIYYTLDGSDPTRNSLSGSSATISGAPAATVTLKAMAVAPGMADSDIAAFTYYLQPQAASPTSLPASGSTVENNSTVTLSTATAGATIHYTTDGSTPTGGSTSGTSVVITGASGSTVTIKAFAAAPDMVDSDVAVFTYRIRSSSGSSGGGTVPSGILVTPPGGTFKEQGITMVFPANAVEEDIRVHIREVSLLAGMNLPDNSQLLSKVVDIIKDVSGNFDKPITISISFDKSKFDPEKYEIKICYFNENTKEWVPLDNLQVNFTTGQVSGDVSHFTKFAVIAVPKTSQPVEHPHPTIKIPADVTGHWAENSVIKLMEAGVVSGYQDGFFQPERTISRAEFTVMLVKALKLENKDGKQFTDISDHWAKESILTAAAHGIISGYDENTFGPDDLVTREQAASIIALAARLETGGRAVNFIDRDQISSWAGSGVAAAVNEGFFNGYPDGSFRPQNIISRAESALIIAKLLLF